MSQPLPYAAGSATSRAAAVAMEDDAAAQREVVLGLIVAAGIHGMTRQELERETGLSGDSIRPRVWELTRSGLLEASDEIRRSQAGRECQVLVAASVMAAVRATA